MLLDAGNLNVRDLIRGDAAGKKIVQLVVGTSNTPVSATDTALTNPVIKTILTTNDLPNGILQFYAELEATDPAMTIREVGLINVDGHLVHRKVVPDTTKVAGVIRAITYRIKVQ